MRYNFVRLQVHSKIPNLTGWYLQIRAADKYLLEMIHNQMCHSLWKKTEDPHIRADLASYKPGTIDPIKMGSGWLTSAISGLIEFGTIYINKNYGMWFGKNVKVLEERDSGCLTFPEESGPVCVTISKWPGGRHYYLSSTSVLAFQQDKYNSLEAAREEALRHTSDDYIQVKDNLT